MRGWILDLWACRVSVALLTAAALVSGCASASSTADSSPDPRSEFERTLDGLRTVDGFVRLHLDDGAGRVWLELPTPGEGGLCLEFLYVESLRRGLGSNPIGLDRGQLGANRVVRARRVGGRVLFEVPNLRFRASGERAEAAAAVEGSFASSVIWGAAVHAEAEDGRLLVDLTSFLVRDAHRVVSTLDSAGEGSFTLDRDRSSVDPARVWSFPDNVEVEAWLTYTANRPGRHVRATVPDPTAVTLIQHHSFIRLPDDGYRPRAFDPRCGAFSIGYLDYEAPIAAPLQTRWVTRHRLEKRNPGPEPSPPVEPIVYYVDPGAPPQIFDALVRGASWWNEAFERAGFVDAFRVERLPDDAHPLDVRYNVIQWVHRSTRGWSYGASVVDPRTGEIIKGHVSLGSLRVRQDRLLFESLLGVEKVNTGDPDDPVVLALRRIEQLSAHEVGHTIGLAHNFAASTYGRASVMDYPAPWVRLRDDGFDVSKVYDRGVGEWDIHAVRYLYQPFPEGEEGVGLDRLIRDGVARGLRYLSDADARSLASAHPLANLWDNGDDPVAEFEATWAVRNVALERFDESRLPLGQPTALLHERFVPVYLYHRYQLDAVMKSVGGLDYDYSVRGDRQELARPVPAPRQRRALALALSTLDPAKLDVPEAILQRLVPRPPGFGHNRELFSSHTAPAFDRLTAVSTAAALVFDRLFHPARCARLLDQDARDPGQLGLGEMLDNVDRVVLRREVDNVRLEAVAVILRRTAVDAAIDLAGSDAVTPGVRAVVTDRLREWRERFGASDRPDDRLLADDLEDYFEGRPRLREPRHATDPIPPGSPIGGAAPAAACGCGEQHYVLPSRFRRPGH